MGDTTYNIAGIGGGLARGIAAAYGQKREQDFTLARDKANRDAQIGIGVLNHLIESGRVANYDELMPYVDLAFGTAGTKPKKGEPSPHDILSQVLSPVFSASGAAAAAPGGASPRGTAPTAAPAAGVAAPVVDQNPIVASTQPRSQAAVAEPAPVQPPGVPSSAPAAAAPGGRGGLKILTDAEMIERKVTSEATLARGQAEQQTKLAREFYDTFKSYDPDFTLYDALAMAGFKTDYNRTYGSAGGAGLLRGLDAYLAQKAGAKGSPLTPEETLAGRAEWFAQNRSGGVNREALARSNYGLAFAQLSPAQAQEIIKQETALIGGQSYARTAGGNQADFNAPLTPQQAQASNLPVGTTGPQVAGQSILKDAEISQRRSTEGLRDVLVDIRDRLVPSALPKAEGLQGLLPGAALQLRRRSTDPKVRSDVAALESAVNNVVNVVARTVAEQKGTQTEQDAMRAEAAITALKEDLFSPMKGDTVESATTRINETLKIIEGVLQKLPQQAVPQAPATTRPQARGDASRRARARAALVAAKREATDATIDRFLELNPTFR